MKRRKHVVLPIHKELLFALEIERDRRGASRQDRVLLNRATGKPLTRPRLYERTLKMGRRAGVSDAHPHRFRDKFACVPFVRELRERARWIMEESKALR